MANKELDLFKEILPAIDMGITELYDAAGPDGKKDIEKDLWNLNRYVSSVKGSFEKQALAVLQVNEYYNKNWAVLGNKHAKLQWQLLCIAGNVGSKQFHPWIKLERKANSNSKAANLIATIYPNMKQDEVELLAKLYTKKELKQLAEEYGIDKPNL